VSPTVNHHQPPALVDGSSDALELLRDEHVRQGFAALDGLERLDPATARRLFEDRLQAEARRAADTLPVLPKPPRVSDFNYGIMTKETNHTRVRRLLDFVDAEDRILEIGVGHGYITGMLIREAGLRSYTGIDINEGQIATARATAERHVTRAVPLHLEVKSVYDLTPEWVAEHDPDLVLILEVLEHLPDAEKALATLADCIREDAAILFSVPTHGRLEIVWGHVSIFDAERVRAMCDQAGLVAQHVEVVQDQWVFVLATKSRSVPTRLLDVLRRPSTTTLPTAPVLREFVPVPMDSVTLSSRASSGMVVENVGDNGVRVTSGKSRAFARSKVAAVQFPVAGDERLRLEFSSDTPSNVKSVRVNLRVPSGSSTAQWIWNCSKETAAGKRTFSLRPGKKHGPFKPYGVAKVGQADTAEVVVEARSARKALSFTLHRLASASARTSVSTSDRPAADGTAVEARGDHS
jgi:2-polyprenyl-3-methyl-5-hydroxy-6-metoxy-1,4-benzoquinol methylase